MNCKPGDLAIVVPPACDENIGCLVSVIRKPTCDENAEYDYPGIAAWVVESKGRMLAVFDGFDRKELVCTRLYADDCLRPLPGLPETEDTDTEQPIKELA